MKPSRRNAPHRDETNPASKLYGSVVFGIPIFDMFLWQVESRDSSLCSPFGNELLESVEFGGITDY